MQKVQSVLILMLLFGSQIALSQESYEDPCKKILDACTAAGFTQGKGLGVHCVQPIMQGKNSSGVPGISPDIVQACRTKHPEFGNGAKTPPIDKSLWLNVVNENIPRMWCASSLVKNCWGSMGTTECTTATTAIMKDCTALYQSEIPDVMTATTKSLWIKKMGACLGLKFATAFDDRKDKNNPACIKKR